MKKLKLLVLLATLCTFVNAQEDCSNIPAASNSNSVIPIQTTPRSERVIKLYYHLYYNKQGANGVPQNRPDEMTALLNSQFANTELSFIHENCETRFIYDDDLDASTYLCDFFFQNTSHYDGIDIHVKGDNNNFKGIASGIVAKEILLSGKWECSLMKN